ncbi:Uncharacterized protein TCM_033339 isoform 1 [Theobroma cacao]|uniref:Uncharacterized protein isoform 1 n=1 Tax=Theobroma cacao TaxID=3641 RepID=A0A061FBJ3_THECC|nr:Uncharacterized protein TCM_033339 isoform 1 [Theobroma cacao]EOY14097.1 Uncharacterized protein TCM_033339 isoform 1 [Theobroma cacao]
MAPRNEMAANVRRTNNTLKRVVKKEEKNVKRLKESLAKMKAETEETLRAVEELRQSMAQIREVIRLLLDDNPLEAELTAALL